MVDHSSTRRRCVLRDDVATALTIVQNRGYGEDSGGAVERSKSVCVFCSSSDGVAPVFVEAADHLGALIARSGQTLVYGGGRVGLMGALARSVHRNGGRVVGVIPRSLMDAEVGYRQADELILTRDLRERKAIMEARCDSFICLPGGFGTLEETLEIITLRQLRLLDKPIVILNVAGFYDPLVSLFEHLYAARFARPDARDLYHVSTTAEDALQYLAARNTSPLANVPLEGLPIGP